MLRKRGDNSTPPLRKVLLPRDAFKQPVRSTFSKYTYVMKMFEAWVIAGGVDVAALRTCTSTQVTGWYNEHILPQLRTMQTLHKYIDDGSKWRCGKNTRSIGLRTLYKRVHKHAGDGFACPCVPVHLFQYHIVRLSSLLAGGRQGTLMRVTRSAATCARHRTSGTPHYVTSEQC